MNITTLTNNGFSARIFAGLTIMSLLLSAFPAAFFVAEAASLYTNAGQTVDSSAEFASGAIDASAYENLVFSFDFDASELDASPQDSFTYGWRSSGGDNDIATFNGLASADPAEVSSISAPLPISAQVADLEVYVKVTSNSTSPADEVVLTNIAVDGDLAPVACTSQIEDGLASGPVENTDTNQFFTTIQNAIDDCDTDDGDTIEVAAGTYSESVLIDKSISLLGPNSTISAVTGTRVPEAILTEHVRISATEDVTVSGFELADIETTSFTIYVYADSNGFTFENNRFMNNEKVAIKTGLSSVTEDITIAGNLIDGVTESPQSGLQLGGVTGVSTIASNKIVDTAYGGIVIDGADGLSILNNQIENVPQQGIQLAGTIGDVSIENNTITDANTAQKVDKGAIRIYGSGVAGAVLIKNNTISGGHNGIAIKDGEDITGKDIVVTENDILAPTSGVQIYNGGTGVLSAESNWWGQDTGISTSNGAVDAEPWLCGPFATSPDESVGGVCVGDIVKPTIAIDSPAAGAVFGSDFDVTVTATDDVALDNVVVNLKTGTGGHIGTCLNESAGGATIYTTSCTVDVDALAEGTYNIRTNTKDEAGNLSNTINQPFIVDKTGPVIVVDSPADNLMTGAGFDIEVTATDDYGIGKVVINIKDEFGAHLGTCLNEVADGSDEYSTSCTISLDDWADGTYQFKTNALDVAGNISNTITQTYTINTNRPTIELDSPTTVITTDTDFDVTVTASDDVGISQVVINIKDEFGAHLGTCLNETVGGVTPYTTSCTIDVDSLADGTYNFRTNARDTTGNLSNTINQTFIVDSTPTATVTMCKEDELGTGMSGWTLMLQGEAIGEYEVPANSPAGVDTAPLQAGVSHIVIAEGTWDNNRGPLNIVDAEYSTEDNWVSSIMDGFTGFGTEILELFVGGTGGDWGPYNASHQYAQSYVPSADGPINLAINDSSYGDNTGSLDVTVGTGYVGITSENGCVVFEDVPYGDYEVAEIMQTGFENVSGLGEVAVENPDETLTVVNRQIVDPAPHCGDGIQNGTWEQCDGGESCTDHCTLANQCSSLPLMKVTFADDAPASASFDGRLHLGSKDVYVPNGTWFHVDDVMSDGFTTLTNSVDGAVIHRDVATRNFLFGFAGLNNRGEVDYIQGEIETKGIEIDDINRTPIPGWPLEDGNGNFLDIFEETDNTITFDLRADSGRDAVGFTAEDGEAHSCRAQASLAITAPTTPNLNLLPGSYDFTAEYLDDDIVPDDFAWAIRSDAACNDNSKTVAGNANGSGFNDSFTYDLISGQFEATVDMTGWAPGDYCFVVNPREDDGGTDFRATQVFMLDSVAPEMYTISGVKWDDENGDGEINESESTLNGWTIFLAEDGSEAAPLATTTGGNGEYSFTVPAGTWVVTEAGETGWIQTGQYENGELVASTSQSFGACTLVIPGESIDEANYTCSFGNQEVLSLTVPDAAPSFDDDGGGGGGGTRVIERVAQPTPLVLGVTTDAPQLCPFLNDHMQIGAANNPFEVMKLQAFLTIFKDMFGGTETPITGTFGPVTDANVKAFQETYRSEVLDPWIDAGLTTNENPTGFVYLTTKWKINDILCPGEAPFPTLE